MQRNNQNDPIYVKCPYCKRFYRKEHLERHIQEIHKLGFKEKLPLVQCPYCGKRIQLDRFGKHLIEFHERDLTQRQGSSKFIRCPVCKKTVGLKGLDNHIRDVHIRRQDPRIERLAISTSSTNQKRRKASSLATIEQSSSLTASPLVSLSKRRTLTSPQYPPELPSDNPKASGERKKRMRGE